jgi:hypothetical protein
MVAIATTCIQLAQPTTRTGRGQAFDLTMRPPGEGDWFTGQRHRVNTNLSLLIRELGNSIVEIRIKYFGYHTSLSRMT